MTFDEKFVAQLKADPVAGISRVCSAAIASINQSSDRWNDTEYVSLAEAVALLATVHDSGLANIPLPFPELTGEREADCKEFASFLRAVNTHFAQLTWKERFANTRQRYSSLLGTTFVYEFSQGDLDRVQVLVNELRDFLQNASNLSQEHRQRLMKRLERLQTELHKKVSDLDRFWGLVGEVGVVVGKLGKDAKPMVDRAREIAQIVWQTQARAEELPSGSEFPKIGKDDDGA